MFVLQVDDDILLRLHDAYNVEGFFNLIVRNRNHLGRWMDWVMNHQELSDTSNHIMWIRQQLAQRRQFATQIYYQGKIAGSIGLTIHDWHAGHGEIGYWLGEAFTGKGIATRAARAMRDFPLNAPRLHQLVIRGSVGNGNRTDMAKRLGDDYGGVQDKQRRVRGEYSDYDAHCRLHGNGQVGILPDVAYRIE